MTDHLPEKGDIEEQSEQSLDENRHSVVFSGHVLSITSAFLSESAA